MTRWHALFLAGLIAASSGHLSAQTRMVDWPGVAASPADVEQLRELRAMLDDENLTEAERLERARAEVDRLLRASEEAQAQDDAAQLGMAIPRGLHGLQAIPPIAAPRSGQRGAPPPSHLHRRLDPFHEMERMREMMDHLMPPAPRAGSSVQRGMITSPQPEVGMVDEGEAYRVTITFPGSTPGEVDVRVEGNALRLSGENTEVIERRDEQGRVVHSEQRRGSFRRVIPLRAPVDATGLKTLQNEDGSIEVIIPKT